MEIIPKYFRNRKNKIIVSTATKVRLKGIPKSKNCRPINEGIEIMQPHRKRLFNKMAFLITFSLKNFFLNEKNIGKNKKIDATIAGNRRENVVPDKKTYG